MAARDEATEETKMEMTPMIDVTFLLLIFFMCSIKFKVLEGKLQTYLPKDVGVNPIPIDKMLEKVDVRIVRVEGREQRNLEDLSIFEKWDWSENQIQISLMNTKIRDLKQLETELKKLREANPVPPGGTVDDDPLKMNVEAMKGVIYEDVVKVVDVAIKCKFQSITFRGIEADA